MAFQFSLASVLRVREMTEEREEGILQKILQEISKVSDAIERTDAQLAQAYAARLADTFKPSIGLDLHASYGEVKELKERRKELQAQLPKLEQARNAQLIIYETARRSREMLTDIREKRHTAYRSDVSKREQKVLDDNFVARQSRP